MPEMAYNETWSNGKLVSRIARTVSDMEIDRREARQEMREALPFLHTWGSDALSAAELTALTPAQRIARQAQQETRSAKYARLIHRIIWELGEDDGA